MPDSNIKRAKEAQQQTLQQSLWSQVDHFLMHSLIAEDIAPESFLEYVHTNGAALGLPAMAVAPNQGKMLQLLVKMSGAKRVLEIGTLVGYSTLWLAQAVGNDGKVITLELRPEYAKIARENVMTAQLGHVVEVLSGAAQPSLQNLIAQKIEPFDFIFIDADKPNLAIYMDLVLQLSRQGTVIVVDNIVRMGEILNPQTTSLGAKGIRQFFEYLAKCPFVTATAIQTVGVKGHDGFVLAVVNHR